MVVAADLASGEAWATERLGCAAGAHGRHDRMGTHNALWGMGSAYLEVIAVDPRGNPPARARWFGLDDPQARHRLAQGPYLATWAVRCSDLSAMLRAAPVPHDPPLRLARDDLTWEVALPIGAGLPMGGAWPLSIHWLTGLHPARRLADAGLALERLTIAGTGAGATAAALCDRLGFDAIAAGAVFEPDEGPTRLSASIRTSAGIVQL